MHGRKKNRMEKRIQEMYQFLAACKITGYLADDQIELLLWALKALEEKISRED